MNEKQNHRSLDWVSQGLDEAIIGARQTLESYLSGASEPDKLIECRRYLETILASFDEVEFPFATLLSEQLILLIDVIIKDNCISDNDAYQALLGGLLQLPNYIVRLRTLQNDKASDIIAVVNDVRAAANVPLIVDQKVFALTHSINQKTIILENDSVKAHLQSCQTQLVALNNQAENSRLYLDGLYQAYSELMADLSDIDVLSEDTMNGNVLNAIDVLITAAANSAGQFSLSAKYALKKGLAWLEETTNAVSDTATDSSRDECQNAEQVLRELLFCIALYDSDVDKVQILKRQQQLLEALNIHHPSEVLRLGTPDAETMEIVFDSLISDFVLLKNALEWTVESDSNYLSQGHLSQGHQSSENVSFEDMASMASTIRYTLQLAQYDNLAEQLIAVESELMSLHIAESGEQDNDNDREDSELRKNEVIKNIAEELYKIESRLHQNHLGVTRSESEISVIDEVIHCVSTMAENLSVRQSSSQSFFDDTQFLNYEPCGDLVKQLNDAEGAMKMIAADNLVASITSCVRYLKENIIDPQDATAANPLIVALKSIASYLEAFKYNQQTKMANPLSQAINNLVVDTELATENEKVSVLPVTQKKLEGDFDDDIVEIFIEEAEEVLISLKENITLWSSDNKNVESMADIRRGFHTLKGSGRMAGAEHIGDAAWSIEALLNRMTDGSVSINDARIAMIDEAINYMPQLIESFKQQLMPIAAPLMSFIGRANQLATDTDTDNDNDNESLTLINESTADSKIVEAIDNGDSVSRQDHHEKTNESTVDSDDEKSEQKIGEEANSNIDDVIEKEAGNSVLENGALDDSALQTIFVSELEIQLSVVNGYLESHAMDDDIYPSEAVERALHTIVGGARIANNQFISELFAPAEILVCLIRKRCAISDEEHGLLIKLHNWTLSQINFGQFIESNVLDEKAAADLAEELNQAVADDLASADRESSLLVENDLIFKANHFLQEWRATGSRPESYKSMLSALQQLEMAAADGEQLFVEQQCQCLSELYKHFSEGGLHYQAYITLLDGHRDLEDMLDRIAAGQNIDTSLTAILETLLANEKNLHSKIERDEVNNREAISVNKDEDFNQEIVSIFLDESEDLIETLEADVQQWLNNRSDISYLKTLMRPLHTIKGGARMAGLEDVGDISHEFETLLLSVSNGDNNTNAEFFKQVSQFVSQLTDAVSAVRARLVADASDDKTLSNNDSVKSEEKRSDEMIRVPSVMLEKLVNLAGETSISRSLIEEQVNDFSQSTDEIDSTIQRLKEQLRRLEIEMEAQIEFRKEQVESEGNEEFDPLEMDRYSQVQQLSKSLVESASDLKDLKSTLVEKTRDIETSLVQQARINTQLQEGLMQTRTVPLARHIVPRLRRIVRQVSGELDKPITFKVSNAGGELDRSMLERMVTPLEHVLRNAIDHGIETSEERLKLAKPEQGIISLNIRREGGDVVLELSDDGRGLDVKAIRKKALSKGLIDKDSELSDEEVMRFIFAAGFSTAKSLTQLSGRGVGMDVVQSEIADLGGSVELHSKHNQGTRFTFRVPFTVSMNRALLVSAGGEQLAVPLDSIEGIVRVSPFELEQYYGEDATEFLYAGQQYDFSYLGHLINGSSYHSNPEMVTALPVLLVRGGDKFFALQVDRLIASREIVVKSLGAQFANLEGIAGATVLGDGSVVMIADLAALVRSENSVATHSNVVSLEKARDHLVAMVVDDSVTVRKVTSRLLERRGMDVVTAKDGLDAMLQLEDVKPDFILLDIEMPRMDGFEVVTRIRNDADLADIPIIMITSRTGDKHRERALGLGANAFLGKPYQEEILFDAINNVLPTTEFEEQFGT